MRNQINSELALFEAFIAENPSSQLFLNLAEIYRELGRTDDAIAVLTRALPFHGQNIKARMLLASLYKTQNQPQMALEQLSQAALNLADYGKVFTGLAEFMPRHKEAFSRFAVQLEHVLGLLTPAAHDYHDMSTSQLSHILDKLESLRKAARLRYS